MKRPMMFAGVVALILSVAFYYAPQIVLILFLMFLALGAVIIITQRKYIRSVLPILLVIMLIFLRGNYSIKKAAAFQNIRGETTVCGIVTDVSVQESSVFYTIKSQSIDGKNIKATVSLLCHDGIYACVGDKIEFSAVANTDNVSAYGNEINMRQPTVISLESDENIYSFFEGIRKSIRNFFFENMPYDNASMLLGILLGDKSGLSEELSENIKRSGVSHIVVTSGMHLAIITKAFFGTKKGGNNKFLYSVLGIIFVSAVIMLTGASPSILRAALMYYIIFAGLLFSRRADALNSLFASAVVLVLLNPFVAGNFSFQLSASATFGVIAVAPVLQNIIVKEQTALGGIPYALMGIVATSLSATLLTAPFIIYKYEAFSLVSVFTNLLLTHFASALLTVGLIAAVFSSVPLINTLLCTVTSLCSGVVVSIVNAFGSMESAYLKLENPDFLVFATALLAIAVSVYCIYKYDDIRLGDKDALVV